MFVNIIRGHKSPRSDRAFAQPDLGLRCRHMHKDYFLMTCKTFSHIYTTVSRSGNFIMGAIGSDKQMLGASSGARAALNIAAEKSKQKR